MKLIEKDNKDADPVHIPWDAAQAALASGAYAPHKIEGERGPDQPAAQSPKPGTDPVDGKEVASDGETLTNLSPVGITGTAASGLPKEPAPPANVVKAAPPKPDVKAPGDK